MQKVIGAECLAVRMAKKKPCRCIKHHTKQETTQRNALLIGVTSIGPESAEGRKSLDENEKKMDFTRDPSLVITIGELMKAHSEVSPYEFTGACYQQPAMNMLVPNKTYVKELVPDESEGVSEEFVEQIKREQEALKPKTTTTFILRSGVPPAAVLICRTCESRFYWVELGVPKYCPYCGLRNERSQA